MKWFNFIKTLSGQTCLHLIMHLLVMITLIYAWKYQVLIEVTIIIIIIYLILFVMLLNIKRNVSLQKISDYLEETTTNYYLVTAILTLFLIAHFIHNYIILSCLGIIILIGPTIISLV